MAGIWLWYDGRLILGQRGVFLLGDLHGTVLIHEYKEEDKRSIKDGGFFFQFLKIRGKEADEGWWTP